MTKKATTQIFIQGNEFEKVCKNLAILSRPDVSMTIYSSTKGQFVWRFLDFLL